MKINTTLILFFTIFLVQISSGQNELKIEKSENSRLIEVLNNSKLIAENSEGHLSVKIYIIENVSGSSGFEEGHEVSTNLLVAVSEFDEDPNQNLFEFGPLYNPNFIQWSRINDYEREFEVEHGTYDARKMVTLKVNIIELKLN